VRPHTRPYLQTFRTELRQSLTPADAALWNALKQRQLDGRKFRRQHSVGDYIPDFYCPSERIAVELDGQVHNSDLAQLYDSERDEFLNYYGIKVLRFSNRKVLDELEFVQHEIRSCFGWWKDE
jgi:very-short-patch-repair endonuclease